MTRELYSNLKLIDYVDHMNAFKNRKLLGPVHIRIKPINACNHNCWYCAYRVDNLDLGGKMSTFDSISSKKMEEICEDIIEMKVEAVTFSGGGEPLLYRDIEKTISSLGRAGVKIGVLTNGTYLSGERAKVLANYASWVRVSMDYWDSRSCSSFREKGSGEFSKIIQNIKGFLSIESDCVLGICFIINRKNSSKIYEFCKLMRDIGVDHVKLSTCIVSMSNDENHTYHLPCEGEVFEQISKSMKLNSASFRVIDHYHEPKESFQKKYTTCPFMQMLTVIGADCKVYSCQDKAYTDSGELGSIENTRFKEYWFSDMNQERVFGLNPSLVCNHHCVANTKNLFINEYIELKKDHKSFV